MSSNLHESVATGGLFLNRGAVQGQASNAAQLHGPGYVDGIDIRRSEANENTQRGGRYLHGKHRVRTGFTPSLPSIGSILRKCTRNGFVCAPRGFVNEQVPCQRGLVDFALAAVLTRIMAGEMKLLKER